MKASLHGGSLRHALQWPVAAALLLLSLAAPARDGHGGPGHGGGSHARAGHGDRHAGDRHTGRRDHSGRSHGRRFHGAGHALFAFGYWPSWDLPYGYDFPPPTVLYTAPVYVEQADESQSAYWYYCPDSNGYYPSVPQCPSGWLRVVPGPATQ